MSRHKPWRPTTNQTPQDEHWIWTAESMLGSITYRALGIHARRVLDFLEYEHLAHGGRENGDLGASYNQLEAWGVARDDIRKGLDELLATGFVRRTAYGLRQAGGGDPSRFALTWLPTGLNKGEPVPATNDWRRVAVQLGREGVATVRAARLWLRGTVAPSSRGTAEGRRKRDVSPHLRPVSVLTCDPLKAANR